MDETTYLPTVRNLISDEDKRAICAADWSIPFHARRCRGRCPLGMTRQAEARSNPTPDSRAAMVVFGFAQSVDDVCDFRHPVRQELSAFIRDWDTGLITPADLPRILGLEA